MAVRSMTLLLSALAQIARLIAEWAERERERRDGAQDFMGQFSRMLQTRIKVRVKT